MSLKKATRKGNVEDKNILENVRLWKLLNVCWYEKFHK